MAEAGHVATTLKPSGSKRRSKKSNAVNEPDARKSALPEHVVPVTEVESSVNGEEAAYDQPHIREIQKNIRNVSKKLTGTAKVEAIVNENPGVELDALIAARKINVDQKTQFLKKPALQVQLTQLEEQLNQLKKLEDDFSGRLHQQRERLEQAHKQEVEALKAELLAQSTAQADSSFRQKILVFSKFLRAAAARRAMEEDDPEDSKAEQESKAFEGLLLLVYGGDNGAADAAERLIEGSNETIPSTEGDMLPVTYDEVKQLSLDYIPPYATEEAWANGVAEAQVQDEPATDPTLANAGLGEVKGEVASAEPTAQETDAPTELPAVPAQADIGDIAANSTANQQWDSTANALPTEDMGESWVSVPRPADETEQGGSAAALNATDNWADQPAEPTPAIPKVTQADSSDGFREVHHGNRGRARGGSSQEQRGRGRGGYRGGEGRGRGHRGDRGGFRGRGRGGAGARGRGEHGAA